MKELSNNNPSSPSVTFHAAAGRASPLLVTEQVAALARIPDLAKLLNSQMDFVFILNSCRQIVFANDNVKALVSKEIPSLYGLRPGEALNCVHAFDCAAGCGTSHACRYCGAVSAIVGSLDGVEQVGECRLIRWVGGKHESLDLRVKGTPFSHDGEDYVILTVSDISHEKRCGQLEDVLLRDLIYHAIILDSAVMTLGTELKADFKSPSMTAIVDRISKIIESILFYHDLPRAEQDQLGTTFIQLDPHDLLLGLIENLKGKAAITGCEVNLDPITSSRCFYSDHVLLQRVLGCLILNAIEASQKGEVVIVGAEYQDDHIVFWVRNQAVLAESVRLQIFKRSFSTKSTGRGLGTYVARLLVERYLFGEIRFASKEGSGTAFYVRLPLDPTGRKEGRDIAG